MMRIVNIRLAVAALALLTLGTTSACRRGDVSTSATAGTPAQASAHAMPVSHVFPLVEGMPDRLALLTMLREQRFDDLERQLADATRGEAANPDAEWRAGAAFDAFWIADPEQLPLLDAWVARSPTSPFALTARARHLVASGYAARGTGWAREVSSEQAARMYELHARARADAEKAIAADPSLVDAYITLIDVARAAGATPVCESITQSALRASPVSFRVRASCLLCLLPRWGGSYERMQALAEAAQARVSSNPRLPALLGFAAWDEAREAMSAKAYDRALDLLGQAMAHGDHWRFYETRGDVYAYQNQQARALEDYEQALRQHPFDPDLLLKRARKLNMLDRPAEAMPVLQQVLQYGPIDEEDTHLRDNITGRAVAMGARRVKERDLAGAHAMLEAVLAANPTDGPALYWNGRAYLLESDSTRAFEMFRRAVSVNPGDFDSCQNLDYLLARAGQWPEIVEMWSAYLAAKPDEGRAYYERAGAYRHFDLPRGLADLQHACDLGVADACRHLPGR
jgi:tetratricopeptide (TPR) repeat protein